MVQIVEPTKRRRWRGNKYIWILITLTGVSALLYWEQTAILYVISTLILTVLLLVVGFSDLEGKDRELNRPVETERAAIAGSNLKDAAGSPAVTDSQATKRRKGAA